MAMFALYSLSTGLISSTVNQMPTNPDQIAGLATAGYGFTSVPDGVNGSNAIIDIGSKLPIQFNAPPPPVPNIFVQYIAAQINAGLLSASAFHPVTVAEMNAALAPVNMMQVAVPQVDIAVGPKPAVG